MAEAVTLTDAKIAGLRAPERGQAEISDAKVPGLRLRIGATGNKSFIVRKRVGEKVKVITLGRYDPPRFGLAEARRKARTALSDLEATGELKAPAKAQDANATTIRALWPLYSEAKADLRSIGEIRRIFDRYILPVLGDRKADTLNVLDVAEFIDGIGAPVMARAVHVQLHAFYEWAIGRMPTIRGNPCHKSSRPKAPPARERVLSDAEIAAVWHEAGNVETITAGIRLLILTLQRRGEVFRADRSEIDLKAAQWTIPAERAKNGETHIVPLSAAAVAILRGLGADKGKGPLFPLFADAPSLSGALSKPVRQLQSAVAARLGSRPEQWGLHDLRRTGVTGLQRLGVRWEVNEAVTNHRSGSRAGVAGVYQRHHWTDEKRAALDAWAAAVMAAVKQGGA